MRTLKIWCVTGLSIGLVATAGASPALASDSPVPAPRSIPGLFSRTPSAGGPGTTIQVQGKCPKRSNVQVRLTHTASVPSVVEASTATEDAGSFSIDLTNPWGSQTGAPRDAEISVNCFAVSGNAADNAFDMQWFAATDTGVTDDLGLVASRGTGPCSSELHGSKHGPDGCSSIVRSFDYRGRIGKLNDGIPWDDSTYGFGGVAIAVGEFALSGDTEVVVGSPSNRRSGLRILTASGGTVAAIENLYGSHIGSVSVAVGDINNDGEPEIVTAPGHGGGPHVKVFSFDDSARRFELQSEFFAYDPAFRGGVTVAVADVDGDGPSEIVTGAGRGGGPEVRIFDSAGATKRRFLAYAPSFTGGINVAAGRLRAVGPAEIVTGAGQGGGPHVRVFGQTAMRTEFFAYAPEFDGGVNVAVGGTGSSRVIATGAGGGGGPHVRIFDHTGGPLDEFLAFGSAGSGANVALPR